MQPDGRLRLLGRGLDVARLLEALHGKGLVHRGLKPDSLLVLREQADEQGTLVLSDMRLLHWLDEAKPDNNITQHIIGTKFWWAGQPMRCWRLAMLAMNACRQGSSLPVCLASDLMYAAALLMVPQRFRHGS